MHRLAFAIFGAIALAGLAVADTPPVAAPATPSSTAPDSTVNFPLSISSIPPAPDTAPAPSGVRLVLFVNTYNFPVTVEITSGILKGRSFVMPPASLGLYRGYVWVPTQRFSADLEDPTGQLLARRTY